MRVRAYCIGLTSAAGSSTASIVFIEENSNVLSIANLGDSGVLVIRDGLVHFKTQVQQHYFNCPYQIGIDGGRADTSTIPCDHAQVLLESDDVVLLCTDGILDNLFDTSIVETVLDNSDSSENAASSLVRQAWQVAHSTEYTPFEEGVTKEIASGRDKGQPYTGGKVDDITAIVIHVK